MAVLHLSNRFRKSRQFFEPDRIHTPPSAVARSSIDAWRRYRRLGTTFDQVPEISQLRLNCDRFWAEDKIVVARLNTTFAMTHLRSCNATPLTLGFHISSARSSSAAIRRRRAMGRRYNSTGNWPQTAQTDVPPRLSRRSPAKYTYIRKTAAAASPLLILLVLIRRRRTPPPPMATGVISAIDDCGE